MGEAHKHRLNRSPPRRTRSRSPNQNNRTTRNERSKSNQVQTYSTDLNKLKAQVMKARLKRSPELAELEKQLANAMGQQRPNEPAAAKKKEDYVVILPAVDSRGRRVMIGSDKNRAADAGKSRGDTGAEDDLSIQQMARHERETAGDDQADRDLVKQITRDSKFTNDLDYIDDNVARLTQPRRQKTSEQKRQDAIRDYKTVESTISICDLCFKQTETQDGATTLKPPDYPVIALGNRVYLGLPNREPMSDGHCIIAPIEHIPGSSLKCDDDAWAEITNFMKTLMQMFAARGQGVVFLETVVSTSPARAHHSMIECIPMPMDTAQDAPAYFKESILDASDEWSQNRKIIDTTMKVDAKAPANDDVRDQDNNHADARAAIRRGGFRNTMTAQVPYFHVWFDHYGGLGHVIENADAFPPWFGREVVAGMLDLPPTVYRRPRKLKESRDQRLDRADEWKKQFGWSKFDWTKMLE
ncbi:Pre-mRNA-splicing factor cwf19 [Coemansia sp. RSA 1813]|nr:Pre-mRNA-splicing factor cwf19 [Coemansia sp. RSA 1843]KAJ2213462.1 Pre-mRNA-splicing factor cwf19 [Coemansia sp. RSA 487]KAJ2565821.1 Pre-mRNA-splicing factor cwf19 [Coemansia sp. RSA 1813]